MSLPEIQSQSLSQDAPVCHQSSLPFRVARSVLGRLRRFWRSQEKEYFSFVERTTMASAPAIADSVIAAFAPSSVLDVGCGTGALLDHFRSRGLRVKGVEFAPHGLRMCRQRKLDVLVWDLRRGDGGDLGQFDVAICVEVAHQLPETSADPLVDWLCHSARQAVVFSANTPGMSDRLRLNEQPHEYWIDKFSKRGFRFRPNLTRRWRDEWRAAKTAPWFYENTLVFATQHVSAQ
jgi:SAM-dependent methyltransferase